MKVAFAEKCNVVWPCDFFGDGSYEQDGALPRRACENLDLGEGSCPRFWSSRADGWCVPPIDGEGPCLGPKDMRGLTVEQKIMWASGCLVDWRCVGEASGQTHAGARGSFRRNEEFGPI